MGGQNKPKNRPKYAPDRNIHNPAKTILFHDETFNISCQKLISSLWVFLNRVLWLGRIQNWRKSKYDFCKYSEKITPNSVALYG